MNKIFKGKSNIEVQIIADSISKAGDRVTTFELTYPRIIHAEFMTHRVFTRNAMSSRAVPVKRMVEIIQSCLAMPVRFGANQPGMQDKGLEHEALVTVNQGNFIKEMTGREAWEFAANQMGSLALAFDAAGYHKQVCNRLIEPFQMMKTVMTATELNNFWWLRVDADADPTIDELSKVMKEAFDNSMPEELQPGQWHTPYVEHFCENVGTEGDDKWVFAGYYVEGEDGHKVILDVEEAKAISASCCAQVSYRRLDNTKEKALDIYGRLLSGRKVHASPFEHQCSPIKETIDESWKDDYTNCPFDPYTWEEGITHVDRQGNLWSGNLKGFIQHRQLLKNNVAVG